MLIWRSTAIVLFAADVVKAQLYQRGKGFHTGTFKVGMSILHMVGEIAGLLHYKIIASKEFASGLELSLSAVEFGLSFSYRKPTSNKTARHS